MMRGMGAEERRNGAAGIDAAAALAEPLRRRVYEIAIAAAQPVGRDDVAAAAGIKHSLAGYHLDLLVEAGLLTVSFARRSGRTGPGAGRPAKLYARAPVEVQVQLPPRDDALVAHLLASAVERDTTGGARTALTSVATETGRQLGTALAQPAADNAPHGAGFDDTSLLELLTSRGYEAELVPAEDGGGIQLRNCPFHHLTGEHLELVCGLNHDLLGALVGASAAPYRALLQPAEGRCCVLLTPDLG